MTIEKSLEKWTGWNAYWVSTDFIEVIGKGTLELKF